jgi:hypothetical protein
VSTAVTRAVWSLWTKPPHHWWQWTSTKHFLLAWILSVETARQHYPETVLVTDDEGARILVDGLGLDFNHVSTELNALHSHDPDWWVLGKLYAYRAQTKPFIHLDYDVFLWKAPPERLSCAPVFTQNPEYFPFAFDDAWYRPHVYDVAVKAVNGWLPVEWDWYVSLRGDQAFCCGILGGNRTDFISYYADTAIRIIEHPHNQLAWSLLGNKIGDNILFEQYFLAACIAYHKSCEASPYHDLDVQCLFPSAGDAFTPERAREAGYAHLIGGAKQDQVLAERLEKRVLHDYPSHYERCLRYLEAAKEVRWHDRV